MQQLRLATILVVAAASIMLGMGGCKLSSSGAAKLRHAQANSQLANGGQTAKDIYYACLLNGLAQGLPLAQIKDECAVTLGKAATKGLPGAQVPERGVEIPLKPNTEPFDPSKITAACEAGDGNISQTQKQTHSDKPVMYRGSEAGGTIIKTGKTEIEAHGYGTYGGYGKKDPEDGAPYQGLSKEESIKQKAEAIKEAKEALEKYLKAQDTASKEQDPGKKKELQKEADELKQEWHEKYEKALEDPNKKPKGTSQVSPDSECEQALETARELLYECHRTKWGSAPCKDLEAKMSHCPDPTQIYVDPEAGYSCVAKIDTEALLNAWVANCEKLKRFDPSGGGSPCRPPTLDGSGRYVASGATDAFCESAPDTYVTPDVGGDPMCLKTIDIKPFGEPDFQKMIVWGLDKFGGPIIVIGTKDPKPPSPKPGPEPKPGPKP